MPGLGSGFQGPGAVGREAVGPAVDMGIGYAAPRSAASAAGLQAGAPHREPPAVPREWRPVHTRMK